MPILCSPSEYHRSGESRNTFIPATPGRGESSTPYIRHQQLARWYQSVVAPYRVRVDNLTTSFRSGLALLAVLRRYRPELMSAAGGDERFYADLKASFTSTANWQEIRARAFDAIQQGFGLSAPSSVNDKETMYDYLSKLRDILVTMDPQPMAVMTSSMLRESPQRSTSEKSEANHGAENAEDRLVAAPAIYGHETEEERQERHKRRLQVRKFYLLC